MGPESLYCSKWRKISKSCSDLDLGPPMRNIELVRDIFKYNNVFQFHVLRSINSYVINYMCVCAHRSMCVCKNTHTHTHGCTPNQKNILQLLQFATSAVTAVTAVILYSQNTFTAVTAVTAVSYEP